MVLHAYATKRKRPVVNVFAPCWACHPRAGRKLWLRPDSQNQDLFFFEPVGTNSGAAAATPGVSSRFFLDPEGRQTDELQDWLQLVDELHRDGVPILPLFINGQVKVGCNGLTLKVGEHRVRLVSPICNRAWREKVRRGR